MDSQGGVEVGNFKVPPRSVLYLQYRFFKLMICIHGRYISRDMIPEHVYYVDGLHLK